MEQNIFQFAIQTEHEAEKYYRDLAAQTSHAGMKNILNRLAEEEVRHARILADIAEGRNALPSPTTVLPEVKAMFAKITANNLKLEPAVTALDVYAKAKDFEFKSRDFYLQKAQEVTQPGQKEVLMMLAEEEKKHAFLIDNIIDFVSRPDSWIEDAEFNHLDDY